MVDIASLNTCFDEIEETNGDDECFAWLDKIFGAKIELARFVASRRGRGTATEYVGFLKGSFNLSFRFRFSDDGPDAIIRFPKPGHTAAALRDEKVTNEVRVMEYISQNTSIPVPHIYSWGLTAESPQHFGPFIIMDYVEGSLLSTILKQPTDGQEKEPILRPDIESTVLDKIYRQIASFLLQLSRLAFPRIGAISKEDETGPWSVTRRPLTYNSNELISVSGCSVDIIPREPFDSTSDYLASLAKQHLRHLRTQRNIANNEEIAQARYVARHGLHRLISTHSIHDTGPFLLFCDDLRPTNMLVDPETLQITAVLDFEYTNAMPAQFTYDPPWWLLLSGPEAWLDRGSVQEFLTLYEPRMEQFLQVLQEVEDASVPEGTKNPESRLAARMRESWTSGRFWFNYAVRKSFDLDAVYWAFLHGGDDVIGESVRKEMPEFIKMKMEQLEAYTEECNIRFRKNED